MSIDLNKKERAVSLLGSLIWLIAALFFLYEFFLRVFIGTISPELTKNLHIGAEQLSLIGAAYFWTYGLMQLPVGILVDKLSMKLLLTIASAFCVFGVFLFAISTSFYLLLIARLLMGLGSSFGFVCLLKISLNWFSHKHFGFLSGLSQLLGAVGPVLAGAPLVYVLLKMHDNWRVVMSGVGIIGVFITILIWLFVRSKPVMPENEVIFLDKDTSLSKNLGSLFKNFQAWIIVVYSVLVNTSLAFLGIVWGTTYLETRGMSQSKASLICSFIWVGYAIGSPLLGFVSDRKQKRKTMLMVAALSGILFSLLLIYTSTNSTLLLAIAFIVLGIAGSGQSLAFAIISEQVKSKTQAAAFGLNNACILLSSSILLPIFGFFIQSVKSNSSSAYHQSDFTLSLFVMLFAYIVAFIFSAFLIKETYCKLQLEPTLLEPTKENED